MRGANGDEIVSAVERRAQHHVPLREQRTGALDHRRLHRRTVGADHDDCRRAGLDAFSDRGGHTRTEIAIGLRTQRNAGREAIAEPLHDERGSVRRSELHDYVRIAHLAGLGDGMAAQPPVDVECRGGAEVGGESRLHLAEHGRAGEDDDSARAGRGGRRLVRRAPVHAASRYATQNRSSSSVQSRVTENPALATRLSRAHSSYLYELSVQIDSPRSKAIRSPSSCTT